MQAMAFQPHQNNNTVDGEEKREKKRERLPHTRTHHTQTLEFLMICEIIFIF